MKNLFYLILVGIFFSCCSVCCGEFYFMTLKNESNDTIHALLCLNYPDTTKYPDDVYTWATLSPGESDDLYLFYESGWDAFKKHPVIWLTVYRERERRMYTENPNMRPPIKPLKRYALTYAIMERHKYTITYPNEYNYRF